MITKRNFSDLIPGLYLLVFLSTCMSLLLGFSSTLSSILSCDFCVCESLNCLNCFAIIINFRKFTGDEAYLCDSDHPPAAAAAASSTTASQRYTSSRRPRVGISIL